MDVSGSEWQVPYASSAAAAVTGLPVATLTSQSFQASFDSSSYNVSTASLRSVLESCLDFHLKCSCVGEAGVKVWLQAHFWPAKQQNPRNVMPAVGFPVSLDDSPSQFDKYYFVLLDKST